ncbi:hypothetical protein OIU77_027280 [Salix suchowensis]|uniref:Uncharacterized protein n=1 Tax=Salix suchowensis TaxID=1278906 RepID=A0ABQ9BRB7_9ROSI|nr:hypothetical protein OIU77_027280 [Salix suchowensis]
MAVCRSTTAISLSRNPNFSTTNPKPSLSYLSPSLCQTPFYSPLLQTPNLPIPTRPASLHPTRHCRRLRHANNYLHHLLSTVIAMLSETTSTPIRSSPPNTSPLSLPSRTNTKNSDPTL